MGAGLLLTSIKTGVAGRSDARRMTYGKAGFSRTFQADRGLETGNGLYAAGPTGNHD